MQDNCLLFCNGKYMTEILFEPVNKSIYQVV